MINNLQNKKQTTKQIESTKFIVLLSLVYLTIMLAALSVIHKEIIVFGFKTSAAATIFPLWFTLSDIITEVYGYQFSKKLLYSGMIAQFLYILMCYVAIHLPSPKNWGHQFNYDYVFNGEFRLYFSVLAGIAISGITNVYLISKWKILLRGKYFWLRNLGASTIGEFVYTTLVSFMVFFGTMPEKELFQFIVASYFLKIIYSITLCYPAAIIANILIKIENIDAYDFTPFFKNAPK